MPLVPFHGWLADGYKSMPIPAVAVFSGDPLEGRRLRLPADRAAAVPVRLAALPDADAADRAGLDPVGDGARVHDPRRPARGRLLERRAARLHHARDLLAAPRGRPGRAAADGQPRRSSPRPLFFIVAALAARAGGSEKLRDMGGIAFRAPVLAIAVLDRRACLAGDARVLELRRRVHDPARRVQVQARDLGDRVRAAWSAPPSTRCGCSSRRCTTASAPTSTRARSGIADAVAIVPLVLVILVLAFYPQFVLKRESSRRCRARRSRQASPTVASR